MSFNKKKLKLYSKSSNYNKLLPLNYLFKHGTPLKRFEPLSIPLSIHFGGFKRFSKIFFLGWFGNYEAWRWRAAGVQPPGLQHFTYLQISARAKMEFECLLIHIERNK